MLSFLQTDVATHGKTATVRQKMREGTLPDGMTMLVTGTVDLFSIEVPIGCLHVSKNR